MMQSKHFSGGLKTLVMKEQELVALVVDDEPDMCWALEQILQGEGFGAHKAYTAEAALDTLKNTSHQLVFLDIKLPDIDGLELARQIKATYPSLPVITISGYYYSDDPAIQKGLEEKVFVGFISKPFEINEIRNLIHRVIPKIIHPE